MSAHMREHHIKETPYQHMNETRCFSENMEEGKSTPWREAFKEGIEKFSEIGLMLKGGRYKAGLSQKALAEKIGVKPHHISEMEHGKRPIGRNMAHRLAKTLGLDYRVFL